MIQVASLGFLLKNLLANNVCEVVVSPGSRNAPLTIALRNDRRFRLQVVVDERSAAFIALGMSQQLQTPVVLVCTSGTATLNYGPALAEAYYQGIPLIAVTADRPPEWIDRGEGQCIRQANVFSNYVKASFSIDISSDSMDCQQSNREGIAQMIRICNSGFPGPVHINFPFREPLYGWPLSESEFNAPLQLNKLEVNSAKDDFSSYFNSISASQRVLVLVGQLSPSDVLQKSLSSFANLPNVVVMTEHHGNMSNEVYCASIDRLIMRLSPERMDSLAPEIVITIGRNIISRKVKAWLRKAKVRHWQLESSTDDVDVFGNFEAAIRSNPAEFFSAFEIAPAAPNSWKSALMEMSRNSALRAHDFYRSCPWSDLSAIHMIHLGLPSNSALQMGNSSIVRYFLLNEMRSDVLYFSNRGVAGIDGCVSTAVGASSVHSHLTTAVVGDVSFFYDSNALWNNFEKERLRIIVVNNGGGGIFRIIDGSKDLDEVMMSENFETHHHRSAEGLANMYKIPFFKAAREVELIEGLKWLYAQKNCAILEVVTDRHVNPKVLNEFFEYCKINP